MDATGMTLEEAAIFAEFEDDPDAIDTPVSYTHLTLPTSDLV